MAILVSQIDFCSEGDENCETLGLAKMSGMCDPENSCNVNQNTGLSLAFTIGKFLRKIKIIDYLKLKMNNLKFYKLMKWLISILSFLVMFIFFFFCN